MLDGLYHFETGLPFSERTFQFGTVGLNYSIHAREEAYKDRYQVIKLPDTLNTDRAKVIECEVRNGRVNKIVYRTAYDSIYDLIIVIALGGRVKTVWLNKKTDKHKTLKKHKYIRPLKQVS